MPFPYVDRNRTAKRPALVIGRPAGLDASVWTLMITSARHSAWPGDVLLGDDHLSFGLPVHCYVRTAKLAVVAVDDIDGKLGTLPDRLLAECRGHVAANLGLT